MSRSASASSSASAFRWTARTTLHLLSSGLSAYALKWLFHPSNPITTHVNTQFGGHLQFLTIIGLIISAVTFVLRLLYQFTSVKALDSISTVLSVIAVPVEGVITTLYWGIVAYNPALMMPPDIEFRLPLWLDISMHVMPAVFLWTDFLVFSPGFPPQTRPLPICAAFAACYTAWMEFCHSKNGVFPYPFLDLLSLPQRIMFYIVAASLALGLFHISTAIHKLVERKPRSQTKKTL